MKILQLHTRYRIAAGEDSVVDNEAAALRRHGHDVRQFVEENPASAPAAVGALAHSLHNRSIGHRVSDEIATYRPDVVHVHNTWFALSSSAIAAAGASDAPVVMTIHNYRLGCIGADLFRDGAICTACVGRSPARGVLHGCYRGSRLQSALHATEVAVTRARRVLDRSVDRFVAPSRFMADRLLDIGVPGDRLVVKPHFVVDPGPRHRAPSASRDVLCIGRLAPGKGVDTLLAAWPAVAGDLRLTVIGDGPLDLAGALPERAEILGWRSRAEVAERMLGARALVMPSEWYEPFGMVLIEAMSAGLPIIVTSAAGARSIVGAPDSLVVPPGRPDELAAAIDSLDDDTVDSEGAANRLRFEDRYTETTGVANLEALYSSVVDDAGTRR
jgi:glycosyltransferase involved in cell wall biosynthesis